MKLSELIQSVGDDNVKFQNLFEATINVNRHKSGLIAITFLTSEIGLNEFLFEKPSKVALVIWLPRDKLPHGAVGNDHSMA